MQLSDEVKVKLNNPLIVIYFILAIVPFFSSNLGISNISMILPLFYASAAALSCHFAYRRKELLRNAIPILLLVSLAVAYYIPGREGFVYWPAAFGLALFASMLWSAKLCDLEVAFILGIFLVSTYIHVVPTLMTDYIEEIDPYYDYKWGDMMVNTGHVPLHDWWTYPKIGGLDRSLMPFGFSAGMAYFGELLTVVGQAYHQAAILISVVAAGLSVVVIYYLIKELLYNRKNAQYAAMFGAFLLMLSVGWSTKAHATDCENDAFGGFLLLSLFYVYMYAVNRGDFRVSLLAGGLLYGAFVTMWDGHKIWAMVISFAVAIVSFVGIFKGKRTLDYLKHYAGIILVGNILWRLVIHRPDQFISTLMPSGIELASFAFIVFAVGLNEFMLRYKSKVSDHMIIAIVAAFLVGVVVFGPTAWYNFYKVGFVDVGQPSVVFKTIAEQQPFASSFGDYLNQLPKVYSLSALIALICIPFLLYVGIYEESFGSLVILCWLVPLAWGFYHKSQYIFLASLPFVLGGAWFAQYVISSKKDYDGLRIIPTIIVAFIVFTCTPWGAFIFNYDTSAIFYNVATYDRMGWESTLQYFKTNTSTNTSIITWWDYGHWLTAVSHRFVLIDNLQYDHQEIQDVARFFMKDTTEDDAYKVIEQYQGYYDNNSNYKQFGGVGLDYVAIDWTMIGKSGAMRFIATGNLTNQADGDYNSYTQCGFAPQYSNINGSLTTDETGAFVNQQTFVFACTYNKDGLGGLEFLVRKDSLAINAIDTNGGRIPWKTWMESKNASLFGVMKPQDILSICGQYASKIQNVPPAYTNFIYGSGDFKNFMLARLYFGDNIDSYKQFGLANVDWKPLKHFVKDKSFEDGFVETWKIVRSNNETKGIVNGTG